MGHEVTLGGERLGSGKRNKVSLSAYERSTHNRGYLWKSTMAAGTLVPFMSELATPGTTFDINLDCDVLTHPTIGPLFGEYKIQLDVFQVPIRLYQGKLHMNMLNIGNDMSKVPLPQMSCAAPKIDKTKVLDNQQVGSSCIWKYLGIAGMGHMLLDEVGTRRFNAVPYLAYWEIYKNYYANKQEEIGAVIHRDPLGSSTTLLNGDFANTSIGPVDIEPDGVAPFTWNIFQLGEDTTITIIASDIDNNFDPAALRFRVSGDSVLDPVGVLYPATDIFEQWIVLPESDTIIGSVPTAAWKAPFAPTGLAFATSGMYLLNNELDPQADVEPKITTFPLSNIDDMRQSILSHFEDTPFIVNSSSPEPYNLPFQNEDVEGTRIYSQLFSQEGLALKTYQSDLLNNWIQTEWIDGTNGISEITSVSTAGDSFTIDELNLKSKIYVMLNRIAISGGTYDDWLDAVYTHERSRSSESPMYIGGLQQNLVFQEVVSNAASEDQPLGTLAGRGRVGQKRKGGNIVAKIDEPSYVMGIISLTPKLDYSQGNKWDVNLQTMNDLHKPALDEIGFQDLLTDQMAWFDTQINLGGSEKVYKSAGKQPAWINYMTNINVVRGNFADQTQQMFMTLTRRYTPRYLDSNEYAVEIGDVTTYIDPVKFNNIFADTRRDAQNFWVQIAVDIEARQKMSAKVIPNL